MSQHNTLTRALQEIADWNSHTTEFAVDYGSNGVRDFYRGIARAALSATQPAQAAQGEPVQGVPDGWEIREDDTWIYFKRPDGFCQAVTPNDPHTSHAQTLHMLMRAMLTASPTPPAQPAAAQGAGEVVAWRDHVEQRLHSWRQRFVNKSGDQLALDDFMDKESLGDLIDYVCDEWSGPVTTQPAAGADVLLDALRDNSWDLVSFDRPTGGDDADIGWRVIEHHMEAPTYRRIAEVFEDDPSAAIRAAIAASGRKS